MLEKRAHAVVVDGDRSLRIQERERVIEPCAVDDGVGEDTGAVAEHHPPVLAQPLHLINVVGSIISF
mgnify:CR=1 FL=1